MNDKLAEKPSHAGVYNTTESQLIPKNTTAASDGGAAVFNADEHSIGYGLVSKISQSVGEALSFGDKSKFIYKLSQDNMTVQILYTLALDIVGATILYIMIFYCFKRWFFPTNSLDKKTENSILIKDEGSTAGLKSNLSITTKTLFELDKESVENEYNRLNSMLK